jgi:hypothetical protein
MKYFAKIDKNNLVTDVIIVGDVSLINNGTFGNPNQWKETWKFDGVAGETGVRGNPAGLGSIYDPVADRFYDPSPFPSWVLNKEKDIWKWEPPIPYPDSKKAFIWDEPTESWISMGDNCCDDPNLRQ